MIISKNYWQLYTEFLVNDIKLRYKHSILGLAWIFIKPLVLFTILYLIWTQFILIGDNMALHLLSGVIFLQFITDGVMFGLQSLQNKAHIVLKVNFKKSVVPISAVSVAVINFFINVLVLLIFTFFNIINITFLSLILSLMSIIATILILVGIAFFLSIFYIVARDLNHLVELLLQILFWITPVLYKIDFITDPKIYFFIMLNPFTHLLEMFRKGFLFGSDVTGTDLLTGLIIIIISGLFAYIGNIYFNKKVLVITEKF